MNEPDPLTYVIAQTLPYNFSRIVARFGRETLITTLISHTKGQGQCVTRRVEQADANEFYNRDWDTKSH